ncbi:amidase domain-containing protein [Bacteroidales bacterium OttesenSCG-928-B11]|nr:amidase domain-containing protein [Bacteroidales bacterium OttesenSCG-928-C03]MDL2313136.1 amidase domain-containing protein [Bacteroidales bacterium OttesenSCG-928-B11]
MKKIKLFIFISYLCFLIIQNINAQIYNPDKAAAYATEWCDKMNTDRYVDYSPYGGDCAAFVSQCLREGGLDLSAGTNGNGAYVKPDGVIAGVPQLIEHLKNYQNTTFQETDGFIPPDEHDLGDPMFYINRYTLPVHSYFCSKLSENASHLYSAHTLFKCNEDLSIYSSGNALLFFHIKNSIPAHCDNCEWDGDETGIDCGGSCPPCEHAPGQKSYATNTSESNPLPAATYAIQNITAGNADVRVYPNQQVAFYAIGSVDLLPGFWAMGDSDFMPDQMLADLQKSLMTENFMEIKNESISIFPNPNSGSFTIQSHAGSPIRKVEVYTAVGQWVHTIHSGFDAVQLPSHLQGTLILRIYTDNDMVVRKVVVN